MTHAPLIVFIVFFLSLDSANLDADIIITDIVTPVHEEVVLRAETKGKFFKKGGERVEFFVDGKSVGKTLSGGDGYAFLSYIPKKTGIHVITVKSGAEDGQGHLLSLKRSSGIVFIETEGALFEQNLSSKPRKGSQKVIRAINKRYPVVILSAGMFGAKAVKALLREHDFPELPVLQWGQGAVFSEMAENGLKIRAIIGSKDVIESAREYKPRAFSFVEVDGATEVRDWDELQKKLLGK